MDLEQMRKEIDGIDRKIVELLNARYDVVREVGKWKISRGEPVYVPEREKKLLDKLSSINRGPMTDSTLRAIYREIMSGSYLLEKRMKVAYLGPEATFTHLAAKKQFGSSVEYIARPGIAEVFREVEAGRADCGCVPVENSTEGVVNHTLDLLVDSPVRICAEIDMPIHQCLLSKGKLEDVRTVYSHPQSLAQCRAWLSEHLPGVELIQSSSNTRAAELASQDPSAAAICSELAANLYGLGVLAEKLEDNPNNTTRFLVVGKQDPAPTGDDKTSICFAVKDRVGALYDCLLPFRKAGLTLSMIESRPSKRRNWEYFFFVDLLGHAADPVVAAAIAELREQSHSLKILGSYPR